MNKTTRDKILAFLEKDNHGYSSSDLAKRVKINRVTLMKYLKWMEANGRVRSRQIGMAKVWYYNHSPLLELFRNKEDGKRMKYLFNTFTEGVDVVDKNSNIIWANKQLENWTGMKNLEGKKCYQVFHNMDEPCRNCPAVKAFATGQPHKSIVPTYDSNGDLFYMEVTASPIKDFDETAIAVFELKTLFSRADHKKKEEQMYFVDKNHSKKRKEIKVMVEQE